MGTSLDFQRAAPDAETLIRPYVRQTPLEASLWLSDLAACNAFLKLENLQHTGSFKVRGAVHKLLCLTNEEKRRGIVAASTGNHGAATAYALRTLGVRGTVFVPENAAPTKVAAIRRWGATVRTHGLDGVETERFARAYAKEHNLVYVSPYNDPQVVLGQATIGVELQRQLGQIDVLVAALGGGGLISGVAGYLKALNPSLTVVAASPKNSAVMIESLKAGRILEMASQPTLSDGTAGGVEAGAITFPLCQALVDECVTVGEAQIKAAMRAFIEAHHYLIEGAAGVALAAVLKCKDRFKGQNVAVVVCGANVNLDALKTVL